MNRIYLAFLILGLFAFSPLISQDIKTGKKEPVKKVETKEKAKKTYKRLITETLPFLKRDGILIMCSCSNRIKEEDFMANSISTFKEYHLKYKLLDKLKEEIDHPCNPLFPEGKYFKVHIFRIY